MPTGDDAPPRLAVRLGLLGLTLAVAIVNLWRSPPFYNWDVLPYVAIARSHGGASPAEAHRDAYALAQATVPAKIYRGLVNDDPPYRAAVARDAELFAQVLPFYRVKPLFPFLLHLGERAGVDPVRGGVWLSRLAYLGIAVLLWWWCAPRLPTIVTAVCVPILLSSGFVLRLPCWFSPDALSTLAMLAATILIVEGRARSGWLTMAAAVAVRPDNLIFLALFGVWTVWHRPQDRRAVAAAMAAGLVVQLVEARAAAGYGWKLLFHSAMVERLLRPADFEPSLDLSGYLAIYAKQLLPDVVSDVMMASMAIAVAAAVLHRRWSFPDAPWAGILTITPVYMLVHWLVHPLEKDRTLAFGYLVVVCGVLALTARRRRASAA
jgi:hypothetical protein